MSKIAVGWRWTLHHPSWWWWLLLSKLIILLLLLTKLLLHLWSRALLKSATTWGWMRHSSTLLLLILLLLLLLLHVWWRWKSSSSSSSWGWWHWIAAHNTYYCFISLAIGYHRLLRCTIISTYANNAMLRVLDFETAIRTAKIFCLTWIIRVLFIPGGCPIVSEIGYSLFSLPKSREKTAR